MTPLIINWINGRFGITTRKTGASTQRYGLISDDGVWGLHLDGEHVDLTHIPTGNRLWRFRQLGPAVEALREMITVTGVEWNTRRPMVDEATTVQIESIMKRYDGVST